MSIDSVNLLDYVKLTVPRTIVQEIEFSHDAIQEGFERLKDELLAQVRQALENKDARVMAYIDRDFSDGMESLKRLTKMQRKMLREIVFAWLINAMCDIYSISYATAECLFTELRKEKTAISRLMLLVDLFESVVLHNKFGFYAEFHLENIAHELEYILKQNLHHVRLIRFGRMQGARKMVNDRS